MIFLVVVMWSIIRPTLLFIIIAYWSLLSVLPMWELLHPFSVHDSDDVLSAINRTMGYGSDVSGFCWK